MSAKDYVYEQSLYFVVNLFLIFIFRKMLVKQPVAIMTALTFVTMIPVNMVGMITLFTHLNKIFNPNQISLTVRQKRRLQQLKKY